MEEILQANFSLPWFKSFQLISSCHWWRASRSFWLMLTSAEVAAAEDLVQRDVLTLAMYRDLTTRTERQGGHCALSGGLLCQILGHLLAVQLLYRAAGRQCGSNWIWWVKLSFFLCPGIAEQYRASWCMQSQVITFISVLFYLVCWQLSGTRHFLCGLLYNSVLFAPAVSYHGC